MENNNNTKIENDKPRTRKTGTYKYVDGCRAHYKESNYAKKYYNTHNEYVSCEYCQTKITKHAIKTHQATKRCQKLRLCVNSIVNETVNLIEF
jgi:hypothetical protein